MKKLILTLGAALAAYLPLLAQTEGSVFSAAGRGGVSTTFVTDYQTLGINPSNLGWKNENKLSFGIAEFGVSLYSSAVTRQELYDLTKQESSLGLDTIFSYSKKKEYADKYGNSLNALNADVNVFSISFQSEALGGLALGVRERIGGTFKLNQTLSDIFFRGYNAPYFDSFYVEDFDTTGIAKPGSRKRISEISKDSRISFGWAREFHAAYGRKIFGDDEDLALYGGVGVKYVVSYAFVDVRAKDGELHAFGGLTNPFELEEDIGLRLLHSEASIGKGFGVDIGASIKMKDKITVGASLNEIGSITYEGDLFKLKDTFLVSIQSNGFNNANIFDEAIDAIDEDNLWTRDTVTEVTESLPTHLRLGGSYKFSDMLEVGVDILVPFNSVPFSQVKPWFSIGGDFKPVKWFVLSTGFSTGGSYGSSVPFGFRFNVAECWEAGISTRDVLTLVREDNPHISLALGVLRFKF